MLKWVKKLFDIILPPRCLLCGRVINNDNSLCEECFDSITFITKPYCLKCGYPFSKTINIDNELCIHCLDDKNKQVFRMCRSAIEYDEYSKKLILDFKFFDHIENKLLLARWLNMAGHDIFEKGVDLIIPVPLHYTRVMKRKYNQSAILARELSKICNIKVEYKILTRKKMTIPQTKCSSKERKKNVKNAFIANNIDKIKGKRIVLIDDIYTTGATLKECARVLLRAGAKSVDALTVARVCK